MKTIRRQLRRAFTLLELMIVLAIVAIMLGMVIPTLHGFGEGRNIEHAADQLVALARWARTQAVTQGVAYRLNLDVSNRTYGVTVERNGIVDQVGEEWGRVFKIPPGVNVAWNAPQQQDGQYVRIDPTGRTDPVTIQLSDDKGDVKQLACYTPAEQLHVLSPQEIQTGP